MDIQHYLVVLLAALEEANTITFLLGMFAMTYIYFMSENLQSIGS